MVQARTWGIVVWFSDGTRQVSVQRNVQTDSGLLSLHYQATEVPFVVMVTRTPHKRFVSGHSSLEFQITIPEKKITKKNTEALLIDSNAGSRLLVLGVVARSNVDGSTSPDTSRRSHTSNGLLRLWLLSVHPRDARNPFDDKTRTGNPTLVVASHPILSRASLTSNWAAMWTALVSQHEHERELSGPTVRELV